MNVLDVLQSTAAYFKKRGIENPRLNAEHLLSHTLGRTRMELYLEFERTLGEAELAPLRELVRRRGEGEPLQHLLGTVEFCGHTFLCDKRALVPRPETEQLVELLIADLGPRIAHSRIVDIGTGSGVIALSLAKEFPESEIFATDVSEDALAIARENSARLGLSGHVQFRKSDLLENLDERFDLIVANLPYIATQDRHTLSREVFEQAPPRLHPGGMLALEIGFDHSEALLSALAEKNYRDICSKNDYSGVTRFLFARYGQDSHPRRPPALRVD